jgi:hypothetical protein
VEEGEIDKVPAEAGEEGIAERIKVTDRIKEVEESEMAISSGADLDFVDSLSKESIADVAITVPIRTIYRTATNRPIEDLQIHLNKE